MEKIIVGIAEGKVTHSPNLLVSYALGSCVGICLFDSQKKIAGMAHILLPYQKEALNQENIYQFADTGIDALIKAMYAHGAKKNHMTAKIAGGAEMFCKTFADTGIGKKNVCIVKEILKEHSILITAEDTGKSMGRTITFSAATGKMEVKTVNQQYRII